MKRGNRFFLPLAFVCLLAGGCASVSSTLENSSPRGPVPSRSILLSVLSDRIYLADPQTGARSTVVEGLTDFQAGFATWAPDHRRFAYGDGGIVVVDTATADARTLLAHHGLSMPAWSPDGARIAYGDGRNLWITPAERIQAVYLQLPITIGPMGMAWNPAGSIAFEGLELECRIPRGCSSTDRSEIFTVLSDGAGLTQVTRVGHAELPKWSPDGSRILFVRYRSSGYREGELWVTNADGSDPRRLSGGSDVVAADWSPDGNKLAIVKAEGEGELRLWVADQDGAGAQPLGAAVPGTSATVDW